MTTSIFNLKPTSTPTLENKGAVIKLIMGQLYEPVILIFAGTGNGPEFAIVDPDCVTWGEAYPTGSADEDDDTITYIQPFQIEVDGETVCFDSFHSFLLDEVGDTDPEDYDWTTPHKVIEV